MFFMGLFRKKNIPELPSFFPAVSLIIPCFNEEKDILSKLDNVRSLDYPRDRLEVFFVDGGSSDNTIGLLSKEMRENESYTIVKSTVVGKVRQLNYLLPRLKGEIIVNTDVDARLSADTLKWIVAEFNTDSDVSVVGAYCSPVNAIEVERYYWSAQNKGRFLENDAMSSSIVIAQCYAFRQGFLRGFPEDVIADDIYIAFLAHAQGGRVIYSRRAMARETRCPQSYADFLPHKFRKSNAFLRESLRFLYLLPTMNSFCKMMFITRVAQQLLLPWALFFWFLMSGVFLTMFRYDIVVLALVLLVILFIITSRIFSWVRLPDGNRKYSFFTIVRGYCLTFTVMLTAGISYPFFRQGCVYSRLKK